jgi:hypothetical protein
MRLTFLRLLAAVLLAAVGSSAQATAIRYTVNEAGLQSQQCLPNCAVFGFLTGTITTDGTTGVGLGPSIITSWNLVLNDGTNIVNLTSANSFITSNFSSLFSATPSDLSFDFSGNPNQELIEFTSSSNGAQLAEIFAGTFSGTPATLEPGGVGIWTGSVDHPDLGLFVAYKAEVTELIGTGGVPVEVAAIPEPSTWAMMILGFFGIGFMAYRRCNQNAALSAA